MIVFDFEPDPAFKAKNLFERLAEKVSGAVWIDAEALQVARLEGRLIDSIRFGGGFFGAVKPGPMFVFEQSRINDEVWLPTYAEFNIEARALFVGLNFNQTVRYSNYRRFSVETEKEKLKLPVKGITLLRSAPVCMTEGPVIIARNAPTIFILIG